MQTALDKFKQDHAQTYKILSQGAEKHAARLAKQELAKKGADLSMDVDLLQDTQTFAEDPTAQAGQSAGTADMPSLQDSLPADSMDLDLPENPSMALPRQDQGVAPLLRISPSNSPNSAPPPKKRKLAVE
jgi:hypothetical protein